MSASRWGAVWLVGVLLVACGGTAAPAPDEAEAPGLTPVTIGIIPLVDVAPLHLGIAQGFFAEEGLDPVLEVAQGGAVIVPAVVSGEQDFGVSNLTSLLLADAQGLGVRVVASGSASTGQEGADYTAILTADDSGISDAADLPGRTVAVNTLDNIGTTTIRHAVAKAGGDPDAVTFLELGFPSMGGALAAGRVDAIWVSEPFVTLALDDGAREVASPYVGPAPDLSVTGWFTAAATQESDPELVARFASAMERSNRYAQAHPGQVRATLAEVTDIDPDVVDRMTLPAWPGRIDRASVEALADLGLADGLLPAPPDLDTLLP